MSGVVSSVAFAVEVEETILGVTIDSFSKAASLRPIAVEGGVRLPSEEGGLRD